MISRRRGFLLVEAILAGSIFILIVTAFAGVYLYGQESTSLAGLRTQATLLSEEGLEVVRNIRDEGPEGNFNGLATGTHGLAISGGQWTLSGVNDVTGIFTREIIITDVGSDQKDVVSQVTWQQNAQRLGVAALSTRLTNWQKPVIPNTIFYETFNAIDNAWGGSTDTAVDEPGWATHQGQFDGNDVRLSNQDVGLSPSGSAHLTFNSASDGFQNPEQYDNAYVAIDLSSFVDVVISYYWQTSNVDAGEGLRVAYSTTTTNGIDGTWVQIAQHLDPADNIWVQDTYSLPNTDATAGFVLRFSSLSNQNNENVFIDDVRLTGISDDFVAPAAISNLSASNPTENSIQLSWTAPGDDGTTGTASSYDVRYATVPIDESNWASATQVTGEPLPSVAGSSESMSVSGLLANTTYYFGIKTSDQSSNTSTLSNVPNLSTLPQRVTFFYETFPVADAAWNGSSDTAEDMSGWVTYQGAGDANDVQVSNEDVGASPSGGNHLTFEDADEGFQTPEQYDIAYVPVNLSSFTNVQLSYYWQTDDIDADEGLRVAYSTNTTNGINGTWTQIAQILDPTDDVWVEATYDIPAGAAVSTFVLRFSSNSSAAFKHVYVDDIKFIGVSSDVTAPAAISNLSASNPTENSIQLSWTAPGDDGTTGTASSYDVRYATVPITVGNWSTATQASNEPTPSVAGSSETMTVSGLTPSTTYYFAIKATDDAFNSGGLSNIASRSTRSPVTMIFGETFPGSDNAWDGSSDTAQNMPGWVTYQGVGDTNDVRVNFGGAGSSLSAGAHLTFNDADEGFQNPEQYDIAYVPINLSGYGGMTLSYSWQTSNLDAGEGFRVAYSTNSTNGINGTWVQIAEYINPTDGVWTNDAFSLPDALGVSTFMLRFSSKSDANNENVYIDDVVIMGYAQ